MKIEKKIVVPRGFLFAAGEAGLRTHGAGPDVALMYSTVSARVGAVFTTNRVKAAPVLVSQQQLRRSKHHAQAIVVNAGNANCATGADGLRAARLCARRAASLLGLPPHAALVASTGVIGVPLAAARITEQLPALVRRLHPEGHRAVSQAIMTTDTVPKLSARTVKISGKPIRILGLCKGAGMIHPRMATMLGFFFTDAAIEPRYLQRAVRRMADLSFNRISVDGDTSTNDAVFLLANGLAGNREIGASSMESHAAGEKFFAALAGVAQELAIALVRDGEGAKKVAEIRVEGARSERQAEAIARAIALSPLVKTALAGADPNWGRILSAAGNAGVELNPAHVDLYLNRTRVCRAGGAIAFDEAAATRMMQAKNILVRVVIGNSKAQARFWTCDFTEEYIRINARYRT